MIIETDELDKLRTESDKSINIEGFIPSGMLDPVFHSGRTYYLVPDGLVGQKPYALLGRSMEEKSVQAMVQIILSGKEQLAVLRPLDVYDRYDDASLSRPGKGPRGIQR